MFDVTPIRHFNSNSHQTRVSISRVTFSIEDVFHVFNTLKMFGKVVDIILDKTPQEKITRVDIRVLEWPEMERIVHQSISAHIINV